MNQFQIIVALYLLIVPALVFQFMWRNMYGPKERREGWRMATLRLFGILMICFLIAQKIDIRCREEGRETRGAIYPTMNTMLNIDSNLLRRIEAVELHQQ